MRCLILAAGQGSRLRPASDCKPLTAVAGTPLIEHVIRRAIAAGAGAFTVVTGHQADRIESFVASLADRVGVGIHCVRTVDWDRPNGHSVLAAADLVDGDYLLLMADHLFDPAIARGLIAGGLGAAGTRLAVDRNLASPLLDLEDATKVQVGEGAKIVRIGKEIERFNAIDTGIFLAGPALAEALRAVIAEGGEGSLSSGVQWLADRGFAQAFDATGASWLDVDDPRSLALAETMIAQG